MQHCALSTVHPCKLCMFIRHISSQLWYTYITGKYVLTHGINNYELPYLLCINHYITALAQLVIVNGPTDIIVLPGAIGVMPCGYVNESVNVLPNWNIITRSDNGSVISNMTISSSQINNDNNNGNSDGLVYEQDITSGSNNSPNSRLLVGPVDETHDQSSYRCIFDLAIDDVISNSGTITVAGEYKMTKYIHTYVGHFKMFVKFS